MSVINQVLDRLIDSLSHTVSDAGGLAVPVSGGSDGALCLWLCAQALPGKVTGIHFGNCLRAGEWFRSVAPIEEVALPSCDIEAEALRWAALQSICLKRRWWPVGSRNRTEDILMTYSRASMQATVLPIVGLWKSDVMMLGEHIGVPYEVLNSSRQADPVCGRPQEISDIGIQKIDIFLKVKLELLPQVALNPLSADELHYLDGVLSLNEFKRALPHRGPIIDVHA